MLCLKYTDFSTRPTYQLSCHERLIISKAIKENTERYTENTLHRRKIEMVNARLLVQQFTHPVHLNSSYRLLYLLRQFVHTTGKIRDRHQTKDASGQKTTSKTVHRQIFLFSEKYMYHNNLPLSNSLFCSVAQAVVRRCCRFSVGLTNSSRTAACCVVASLLSSIPTSG